MIRYRAKTFVPKTYGEYGFEGISDGPPPEGRTLIEENLQEVMNQGLARDGSPCPAVLDGARVIGIVSLGDPAIERDRTSGSGCRTVWVWRWSRMAGAEVLRRTPAMSS